VFYGRYVRKLSKRTQRALGELTKVSEERLGNVRTAQAFNGEIQEVHRYNKKIRDLFDLGKKEVTNSPKHCLQ
jgi:putative ABC transport system ATP-binding protein